MKLSRIETRSHEVINGLVAQKAPLTLAEKEFILDKFLPHSLDNTTKSGAFFTPQSIAQELSVAIDCDYLTVIDMAAGIGSLSYALLSCGGKPKKVICVEKNKEFVRIGKKVVPEAEWLVGDIFDYSTYVRLSGYKAHWVISNPPYGLKTSGLDWLNYNGSSDLVAVEIALRLAKDGLFILPQQNVPWTDSGLAFHKPKKYVGGPLRLFMEANPLVEFLSTSIDMAVYAKDWQDGLSAVEMVHVRGPVGLPVGAQTQIK